MNSKLQRIDSYKMSNEDYKSVGRDTSGQGKWIASSPGTTRSTTGGKHSLGLCLDLATSPPSAKTSSFPALVLVPVPIETLEQVTG